MLPTTVTALWTCGVTYLSHDALLHAPAEFDIKHSNHSTRRNFSPAVNMRTVEAFLNENVEDPTDFPPEAQAPGLRSVDSSDARFAEGSSTHL